MTKKKKLIKIALKHPELYSPAEIQFFRMWLRKRKERKRQLRLARKGLPTL